MEEQKPNDIFEKGIKKESPDEDYFEDITPKLEQVIEPFTEYVSHQDLYLNNTQQIQMISNDERSSSSSQCFVENIKQGPFYSESINGSEVNDMKLEPIDDVDIDEMTKEATMETVKIRHTNNSNPRKRNSRCAVCSELKNSKFVKNVKLENDKLIIMIGCVLRSEYTIEKAQSFMPGNNRLYICYTHFSDAFNAICNALHIQNLNDILTCSESLMKNLLSTVNSLRPQLIVSEFLKLLKDVSVRNKDYIQMPMMDLILGEQASNELNKIQIKSDTNRRCAVCIELKNRKFFKEVKLEKDKLIIMVGCALRGEYTIEKAQSFIYMSGDNRLYICYTHFSDAFNAIFNALHILDPNDIFTSSTSLIHNLMSIVNNLSPQYSALMFHKTLKEFVVRNKDFIEMPVMRLKLGEEVPKDVSECKIEHLISKKNLNVAGGYCRCAVCSQKEIRINMKYTSIESEKLIIMVGRILRGDSTFEEARSFIPLRRNCFICHVHFSDAINEIFNALHIQNPNYIFWCSEDLMQKLMITVNAIRPQLPASYFRVLLKEFVLRNEDFIQLALLPMEVDEQAPIDLSENEIKEEPGDFIGKVKEESLDDEYFEQTEPKLEQFVDPYLPSTSSSSTQNMYFPQQSQNFGQYITEVQSSETKLALETNFPPNRLGMEVKQEAEEFLKKVKKEPLEDQYFGQTIPKLEQFVDPCLPSNSSLPTQNLYFNNTQQNFEQNVKQKDFVIEPQDVSPIVCRIPTLEKDSESKQRLTKSRDSSYSSMMALKARCAVCLQVQSLSKLKRLSRNDEKLIIVLGRVLRREHTLSDAKLFISENRKNVYIFICHAHFSEIFNEIYKVLHINNCHEIEMCSLDLIQILMPTVNSLISQATPLQLRTLLSNVALRYEQFLHTEVPLRLEVEQQKAKNFLTIARDTSQWSFSKRHCSVCSLLRNGESLKFLAVEDDKLMIMVGCILLEEYTIEQAKSFMSMGDLFSCRNHYRETIDEICKVLRIQNHNKISMSSSDLMENLMKIVNALCPQLTIQQFRMYFTSFVARNELF